MKDGETYLKESKLNKRILKAVCTSTFLFAFILSGKSYGIEFDANLSDEYKEWSKLSNKEKQEILMPQTLYGEAPSEVLEKYKVIGKTPSLMSMLLLNGNMRLGTSLEDISSSSYSLNDKLDLRVENQGGTTECWAFSSIKALETNLALSTGTRTLENFSERHMDYATTKTFLDGINPIGYNRELGRGGLPVVSYAYLTNGTGAVPESEMPFENNESQINLAEIDKKADTIVTDFITLPSINKQFEKDGNGNTISVKYTDRNGLEYTPETLASARNIIKEQLVVNGAVSSITAANQNQYYDSQDSFHASNYNCNSTAERRDHAVTIVGWDDNYSRDNFADGAKPSTDGAYLVLNSYGTDTFNNGYLYISYEDYFIESEIYGVQSTSKIDYDEIYQHDFYGGIFQIGTDQVSVGYYGTSFKREELGYEETLNHIGVNLASYAYLEIYVNPNGTSMNNEELVKVGETNMLSSGYHRISIDPIKLNAEEFAVVIKQITNSDGFSFTVEARAEGTAFADVTSDGRCRYSINGTSWTPLAEMSVAGVDTGTADLCIKAFTTRGTEIGTPENPDDPTKPDTPSDPDTPTTPDIPDNPENPDTPEPPVQNEFKVSKYVVKDKYIMNIEHSTKKVDFLKNITTNMIIAVQTEDGQEVTSDDEIIKTGMKLKLSDGTEYILIVRGDINKDGRVTLTDISKLILHYNENRGFEITDEVMLKGCDLNCDTQITLTDISQILVLYNSIP